MSVLAGRPGNEIAERMKIIRMAFHRLDLDAIQDSLFDAQSGKCPLCNQDLLSSDGIFAAIDHGTSVYIYAESSLSIDQAEHYANDEKNFLVVHCRCNGLKGALDVDEFREQVESGTLLLGDIKTMTDEEMLELKQRISSECSSRKKEWWAAHPEQRERMSQWMKSLRADPEIIERTFAWTKDPEKVAERMAKVNAEYTTEKHRAANKKARETMGPERVSLAMKKACQTQGHEKLSLKAQNRWKNYTPEQREEAERKRQESLGVDGRHRAHMKALETQGSEGRSAVARKRAENLRPDALSLIAKKGNHTRFHVRRSVVDPACVFCSQSGGANECSQNFQT